MMAPAFQHDIMSCTGDLSQAGITSNALLAYNMELLPAWQWRALTKSAGSPFVLFDCKRHANLNMQLRHR
jgi:hypothetical protein